MNSKPTTFAWLLLFALSIIWGSSFILIKKGLLNFDAGQVASLRILSASLFLLPFAVFRFSKIQRKHVWPLISVGFAGSLIPAFFFAIAQTKIDSSTAGALNALTPIWVIMLGVLFFYQKVRMMTLGGMLVGFAGTVMLVLAGNTSSGLNYYALLVVGATLCYGFNLNLIKYKLADLDAVTITSISITIVGPLAAGYLFLFTNFTANISFSTPVLLSFGAIALLGIMGTAIALIIFNKLVLLTSPVFTSSVTYLIPIVAIIWGVIDNEVITLFQYAGMGFIVGGVYLANKSKR
jgi:drug/metabolite transporter (DMT)-like permease